MNQKIVEEKINQVWTIIKRSFAPDRYCLDMASKLLDGIFDAEGEVYAAEFLEYAANNGNADAMYNLAMCYRWGDGGVYADADEAVLWFKKAAEKGHEEAKKCYEIFSTNQGKSMLLLSAISGVEGQGSKWYKAKASVDHYYALAKSGDAEAQYELARQLENPQRLGAFKHDINEAIHWYTESANNGVVDAMFNLGMIYYQGKMGAPIDEAKAKYWFEQAAAKGDEEARQMAEKIDQGVGYLPGFN